MKTNVSRNKRHSNWLRAFVVGAVAFSLLLAVSISQSHKTKAVALDVESDLQEASHKYAKGSFGEATNALLASIRFLEVHKEQASRSYDVNVMLFVYHAKLAYMFIHSGNSNVASDHLRHAYNHHSQMRLASKRPPIPLRDFVDFAIANVETADANTGAEWKSEYKFETNMIEGVKVLFAKASELHTLTNSLP